MRYERASVVVGVAAAMFLGMSARGQPTTTQNAGAPAAEGPRRERGVDASVLGPNRTGWWNDCVFYEVFVRSFKDSSSGPVAGDGVGDIPGLIEKLDYLNDGVSLEAGGAGGTGGAGSRSLGVTGLWLMPINPSPSYHGYDVTDYCDVQRAYGSLDDVRRLMIECRKRGIKVILDLVLNHCSSEHPWFKLAASDPASEKRSWFVWSASDPGWKGPWGQRVWHRPRAGASDGPAGFYYGIFGGRMPDLNYRTQAVSDEMLRVVDFWIDKDHGIGADGYRLDAVRHLIEDGQTQENTPETHAWLRKFHAELRRANPSAMSIGEVWTGPDVSASYVASEPNDAELDMTFEFDLAQAMVEAARTGKAATVIEAQRRALKNYPPNQYGRFLSNHDQTRVLTSLKGDEGAMRTAAAMLLLGPGVPFIYYGEEIGMTGDKPDENLRRPMRWEPGEKGGFTSGSPWEAMGTDGRRVCVRTELDDEHSLLSWYRTLIRLRRTHAALASGGYMPVACDHPGVYAFARASGAERLLVVMNLTGAEVGSYELDAAGEALKGWRIAGGADGQPPEEGASVGAPKKTLAPHEARVFTLTR